MKDANAWDATHDLHTAGIERKMVRDRYDAQIETVLQSLNVDLIVREDRDVVRPGGQICWRTNLGTDDRYIDPAAPQLENDLKRVSGDGRLVVEGRRPGDSHWLSTSGQQTLDRRRP